MDFHGRKVDVYRAQNGDTLDNIAKKLGITREIILKTNPMLAHRKPLPGEQLLIFNADTTGSSAVLSLEEINSMGQTVRKPQNAEYQDEYDEPTNPDEQQSTSQAKQKNRNFEYKPAFLDVKKLSDQEIIKLANELIRPEYIEKKQNQLEKYQDAVQKIENSRAENESAFKTAVQKLEKEAEDDQKESLQESVKKQTARSSILNSIRAELHKRKEAEEKEAEKLYQSRSQALHNDLSALQENKQRADRILEEERSTDFASELAKLKKENENAVADLYEYNKKELKKAADSGNRYAVGAIGATEGIINTATAKQDNEQQIKITKNLLSSLSKSQAKSYLVKNEKELRSKWGTGYDDLLQNYT